MTSADPSHRKAPVRSTRLRRGAAAALAALVALAASLAGCSPRDGIVFPRIEDGNPSITVPGGPTATPTPPLALVTLRVLFPATQEELSAVAGLFAGLASGALVKESGAVPGTLGATVPIADLAAYRDRFAVAAVAVPAGAALAEDLLAQSAAGSLPDVFVTDALPALASSGAAARLDGREAVLAALRTGTLLPSAVEACTFGGSLYALPFVASTPVLFYNASLLAAAGVDAAAVSRGLSYADFAALLPRLTDTATHQFALYDAAPLLATLPSTRDGAAGWATYADGSFRFSSSAFAEAVAVLRASVKAAVTLDHLTADQKSRFYGTSDPRATGKVAFWIDDSTRIPYWSGIDGLSTGIAPLPYLVGPTLPLSVRAIGVSSRSDALDAAVAFAAFLASDADSLRLQARFGFDAGCVPLSLDPTVWTDCTRQVDAAGFLASLRDLMPRSVLEGRLAVAGWKEAVAASLGAHSVRLLQGVEALSSVSASMNAEAQKALSEAASALPTPNG